MTCAVISVLWIFYPKLRAIYLFVVFAVAIGLIGANYHFLSDIIAGAFVGVSTGWMTTTLWQTRGLNGGTNRKSGNRSDMYSFASGAIHTYAL